MSKKIALCMALVLLGALAVAGEAPARAAVAWQTLGKADAVGHEHWGPEVMTGSQSDLDPVALRLVLEGTPFTQPGRSIDVTWSMDCFQSADFLGTLVSAQGHFIWAGALPKIKAFTQIAGYPISDYSYCQLTVEAARGDIGEVSVKIQARY